MCSDATVVRARNIITIIRSWRYTSSRLWYSRVLYYIILYFVFLVSIFLIIVIILRLFKLKHLSWWYYCERVAFYNGTFVYIYMPRDALIYYYYFYFIFYYIGENSMLDEKKNTTIEMYHKHTAFVNRRQRCCDIGMAKVL